MDSREKSISLNDLWRAIWKNKILLAITTLAITILGIVYTFGIAKPTYTSKTNVLVAVNNQGSSQDNVDYTNSLKIVATVAELVVENCTLDIVSEKHEDLTTKKLKTMVTSTCSSTSYLITITVKSGNKDLCQTLADEVADALIVVTQTNEAVVTLKPIVTKTSSATEGIYSSPNKKLYVLVSFVLGLVVSFVAIFLKEFMSNKFKTKEEIEFDLNRKVLGAFQDRKSKEKLNKDLELLDSKDRSHLEEFNRLLSNIKYSRIENPYKALAIVSTSENELKTTTACNLAVAMAVNGKKVILVDLDIKRPTVHKAFKIERDNGLTEYVDDELKLEEIIRHTENGVDVITAGKEVFNSLAVLESNHLKELMEKLRQQYDYIIIDTTPLNASNDCCVAAKLADCAIYNVTINQSKKKVVKECTNQLESMGIEILGVNVCKLPKSERDSYYYNYYSEKKPE